MKNIWWFC